MKANELMIGDWINEGLFNVKISLFNDTQLHYEYVDSAYADIRTESRYLAECKPIPLTAEILEKNGFVKHDKIHPYYMDYYHERDGFAIFNSRTWQGHILESVHELQHALRLCGLNELADNFKVD